MRYAAPRVLPEINVPRHFCHWMGKFHMVLVLAGHVSYFMALGPVAYPACTFCTVCAQYKLIASKGIPCINTKIYRA